MAGNVLGSFGYNRGGADVDSEQVHTEIGFPPYRDESSLQSPAETYNTGHEVAAQVQQTRKSGVVCAGSTQPLATKTDDVAKQGETGLLQSRESDVSPGNPDRGEQAASGGEENGSKGSDDPSRHSSFSNKPIEIVDVNTANIIVFGETGVGKSSIINLIAGQEIANTSNNAHGCTFHHKRYPITLDNISCALWDTTGLDEGSEGTVPAKLAERNLKELMRGLAHSGGVHLVIYCIRGSRLTKALRRNYDLFYATVCRKKASVALVITGLEHQEGGMETWWTENEAALQRHGMRFDAHACVTAVDAEDDVIQERRSESRELLRELIVKYSRLPGWKADTPFVSRFLPLFRRVFHGTSSVSVTPRKVTVCGSFTGFLPGTTALWDKSTGRIGDRRYEFLLLDSHSLSKDMSRTSEESDTAGLLVFYASALEDKHMSPTDVDRLKKFYDAAGGQSRPVIVVLQGCNDENVAWACRVEMASRYSDIQAHFVSLFNTDDTRATLDEMIQSLCMEQAEVKPQSFWKSILG